MEISRILFKNSRYLSDSKQRHEIIFIKILAVVSIIISIDLIVDNESNNIVGISNSIRLTIDIRVNSLLTEEEEVYGNIINEDKSDKRSHL